MSTTDLAQLAIYQEYEARKLKEFSELVSSFNQQQANKELLRANNLPKITQKDSLFELKKKGILSKSQSLDLIYLDAEEKANNYKDGCYQQSLNKKEREIEEARVKMEEEIEKAKNKYQATVASCNRQYETSLSYYDTQHAQMIAKAKKSLETKKRELEIKEEFISSSQGLLGQFKTSPELTIEKQQGKIYRQLKDLHDMLTISRRQLKVKHTFEPLPELPPLTFELPREIENNVKVPEITPGEAENNILRVEYLAEASRKERERIQKEEEKKAKDREAFLLQREKEEQEFQEKKKKRVEIVQQPQEVEEESEDDEEGMSEFAKLQLQKAKERAEKKKRVEELAEEQRQKLKTAIKGCKTEADIQDVLTSLPPPPELDVLEFEGRIVSKFEYDMIMKQRQKKKFEVLEDDEVIIPEEELSPAPPSYTSLPPPRPQTLSKQEEKRKPVKQIKGFHSYSLPIE